MSPGTGSSVVALTFDMEHPSRRDQSPDSPARLLDALAAADVTATFFIQGRWARSHPDLARRVAADGHVVGSHSHFHAPLPHLTDGGIRADLEAAAEALREVVGTDPVPWFRCPFGAGHDDPRVLAALADSGYRNVHWNVDPADWEPGRRVPDVVSCVVDGCLATTDAAVVLMHTWPIVTPKALPAMIEQLRAAGCTFATVAQLTDDQLDAVSLGSARSGSRG
jgi:peptidoglycan/xylan/chitin deacetylase (PgdA/CDA1 family)